jgi:hypothetical protein
MSFRSFYKSWLKSSYEFGRHASDMITADKPPKKAKAVGTAIDVAAGVGLTAVFGSSMLGWVTAAGFAVAGAVTAPVSIPTALVTVGVAALWVGLGALGASMGLGFMSSAMDKMHIPKPKAAGAKISHAASSAAQAVAKPFKWVGNKLSQAFQKAHDGGNNLSAKSSAPKPGNYTL